MLLDAHQKIFVVKAWKELLLIFSAGKEIIYGKKGSNKDLMLWKWMKVISNKNKRKNQKRRIRRRKRKRRERERIVGTMKTKKFIRKRKRKGKIVGMILVVAMDLIWKLSL